VYFAHEAKHANQLTDWLIPSSSSFGAYFAKENATIWRSKRAGIACDLVDLFKIFALVGPEAAGLRDCFTMSDYCFSECRRFAFSDCFWCGNVRSEFDEYASSYSLDYFVFNKSIDTLINCISEAEFEYVPACDKRIIRLFGDVVSNVGYARHTISSLTERLGD